MAFRYVSRRRALIPSAATALAAGSLLFPTWTLQAEAPPEYTMARKPIYSENLSPVAHAAKAEPSTSNSSTTRPTPTDRLATQIRRCRLFIHANTQAAEDRVNHLMSAFLTQEQNFTSTVASLAPPPQTGERLLPGTLYVLVASMAGSIVSRNRNILLRATTPAAVGIGAAYVVLPYTMKNFGDLMWTFEEKSKFVAVNHLRIRGAAIEGWKQAKLRSERTRQWGEETVREGRQTIEAWVRKGR